MLVFQMKRTLLGLCCLALLVWAVHCEEDDDGKDKDSVGTVVGIDLGTTYSWSVLLTLECYPVLPSID